MAKGRDLRFPDRGNGRPTAFSRSVEFVDDAGRESARHGADRNQNSSRTQKLRVPTSIGFSKLVPRLKRYSVQFRAREEYLPNESLKDSISTSMSIALSPRDMA